MAKAQASQRTLQATAARNTELVKIGLNAASNSSCAAKGLRAEHGAMPRMRVINLRYSSIEAPISGRTSLSTVISGALVTANQADALTTTVQLDPMYVDFTQSSADLLQLKRISRMAAMKSSTTMRSACSSSSKMGSSILTRASCNLRASSLILERAW